MNDVEYMVKYFEDHNPTGIIQTLFIAILTECMKPQYMAGYPLWHRAQEIKKLNIPLCPGMQPDATWCVFVAHNVIRKMGYDTRPFTNKKYSVNQAIGYTSGNRMASEAFAAGESGVIMEIGINQVTEHANEGVPVLVAATGKGGAGHVAIVAPCRDGRVMIGQAGTHNGFFELCKAFPTKYVNEPRFFVPNKKG